MWKMLKAKTEKTQIIIHDDCIKKIKELSNKNSVDVYLRSTVWYW